MSYGNLDYRVQCGFWDHTKTAELKKRFGWEGVCCLQMLWSYARQHRPKGDLTGMKPKDIAVAARWPNEPGRGHRCFVSALVRIGFLEHDREVDGYRIHNWSKHNSWAANSDSRSAIAAANAEQRWKKRRKQVNELGDAGGTADGTADGNPPSPLLSSSSSEENNKNNGDGVSKNAQDAEKTSVSTGNPKIAELREWWRSNPDWLEKELLSFKASAGRVGNVRPSQVNDDWLLFVKDKIERWIHSDPGSLQKYRQEGRDMNWPALARTFLEKAFKEGDFGPTGPKTSFRRNGAAATTEACKEWSGKEGGDFRDLTNRGRGAPVSIGRVVENVLKQVENGKP